MARGKAAKVSLLCLKREERWADSKTVLFLYRTDLGREKFLERVWDWKNK